MLPAKIESAFEGATLITYTLDGRPCWIAREVGEVLGYAEEGKRLPRNISSDWADEAIEGKDFAILTGAELEAFKAALGADSAPSRAPSLMVLFESGIHLACLKTRNPRGRLLRRFLADEVLPQLARTGRYEPEAPAGPTDEQRTRRGELLFAIAQKLEQHGNLSSPARAELYARCYREATGEAAPALLPVVDSHPHTLTSIGASLGISPQKAGKIARAVGVYDNERYCQVRLTKAQHSDKQVEQRFINDAGLGLIQAFARGRAA